MSKKGNSTPPSKPTSIVVNVPGNSKGGAKGQVPTMENPPPPPKKK